ncbi:MAG: methyl-accepting chemotaxis protein [bacterium]|nr:methyl-accepting chemotaxis protein [bacterium]
MARIRRKKFFIHASTQGKYIAFSTLPALLMGLFCIGFIYSSGEQVLLAAKERPMVPIYKIQQTIASLEKSAGTEETDASVEHLNQDLSALTAMLEAGYEETLLKWNSTKALIFTILACGLFLTGVLALFNSHRIAGPMVRIGNSIDLLAEGREIPPVKLRKHDEYKDLAASLDRLRIRMHDAGLLE